MKNTITLTIPFSFKGEDHVPSSKINLDDFCLQNQHLEAPYHEVFCHTVATENNIDRYSYEYEVLHAAPHHFSEATGIAKDYVVDGQFDMAGFTENLRQVQVMNILQAIASKMMGINNLEAHERLQQALREAFEAGKNRNHEK